MAGENSAQMLGAVMLIPLPVCTMHNSALVNVTISNVPMVTPCTVVARSDLLADCTLALLLLRWIQLNTKAYFPPS